MTGRWMLYGCSGFTGRLCVEEATRRGLRPILAGRNEGAVRALADEAGLEARVFPVEDPAAIARELEGVAAVLLIAGPFSATSAPVLEACLRAGVHYLDVTGEIPVFEACFARDADARAAGVAVVPGVGFDVVPTDCLCASLAAALPGATSLELAVAAVGAPSGGTAKAAVEVVAGGGLIRRGGRLERVSIPGEVRRVRFRDRERTVVRFPWGDLATAHRTTGIPDVTTYVAVPPRRLGALRVAGRAAPLLRIGLIQRLAKRLAARAPGPDAETRRTGRSQVWARVTGGGRALEGTLETPEAYALTAQVAVDAAERAAAGELEAGAWTPAGAFGADYILAFPGVERSIGDAASAATA